MEHLRTPKNIRIFIISNVVIYIIRVMSCIQKTSGLFLILYVCWETNTKKFCQFLFFCHESSEGRTFCFLPSADFITSVTCPIIHFINNNGRWAQWDGNSTCISRFLNIVFYILSTGMRFALMQVKTGLCHILSRFEVAPCKHTPVSITFNTKSILLQMHGEIRLLFNRMHFWNNVYIYMGATVAQYLRCCATKRKVAVSIPDGVIGNFYCHNPSERKIALGSTQPLTVPGLIPGL
jgi:hypothetical protein